MHGTCISLLALIKRSFLSLPPVTMSTAVWTTREGTQSHSRNGRVASGVDAVSFSRVEYVVDDFGRDAMLMEAGSCLHPYL